MGTITLADCTCQYCVDNQNDYPPKQRTELIVDNKNAENTKPTLSQTKASDHKPKEFENDADATIKEIIETNECSDLPEDIECEFASNSFTELRESFHRKDNPLNTSSSMHDVSHLCSPTSLKPHESIAVTDGYFSNNIMLKLQHGNNLDLNKVEMKKEKIGRGTSAIVHLAVYNKREIALKEYKLSETEFNVSNLSEFQNELNILQVLDHSNVIHFYGYHLNVHKRVLKFAFEYCKNGNLFDLIHPLLVQSAYKYKDMIRMLLDIANGMKYMHSKHIINRDLKPRNLLLFDDYHVKITDFGASVIVDEEIGTSDPFEENRLYEEIGTTGYKAPEVICVDEKKGYNYKIDIFSFGCICYELWTKQFVSGIKHLTRLEHLKEDLHLNLVPVECPEEFQDVIIMCWKFKPEKRPPFYAIIEMLNECVDL